MAKKNRSLLATGANRAVKVILQFVIVVAIWIALAVIVIDNLRKLSL